MIVCGPCWTAWLAITSCAGCSPEPGSCAGQGGSGRVSVGRARSPDQPSGSPLSASQEVFDAPRNGSDRSQEERRQLHPFLLGVLAATLSPSRRPLHRARSPISLCPNGVGACPKRAGVLGETRSGVPQHTCGQAPGGLTATVRQASLQKTSQTARRLYGKRSETDSSGSFRTVRFEAAHKAGRGEPPRSRLDPAPQRLDRVRHGTASNPAALSARGAVIFLADRQGQRGMEPCRSAY